MRKIKSLVYVNTAVIIALVNPLDVFHNDAVKWVQKLRKLKVRLVTSNVVFIERLRPSTRERISNIFSQYGIRLVRVDIGKLLKKAYTNLKEYALSIGVPRKDIDKYIARNLIDALHVYAALRIGARYLISYDDHLIRFARSRHLIAGKPREVYEAIKNAKY